MHDLNVNQATNSELSEKLLADKKLSIDGHKIFGMNVIIDDELPDNVIKIISPRSTGYYSLNPSQVTITLEDKPHG